ncbi:hypothetical protein AAFX91_38745, partial [Bradyrhizobium sp. 31Argb]|uniref:hypothetical protein n=1 Tax=Bradyrhizobium sp. 31Argb TaxID=3141247 RepID=UPI003749664A
EPPDTDPYVRWCGRGEAARLPPIPIYEGLEACPCRIVCFQDVEENVEAVGDVAKAIFGPRQIPSGMMSGGPDGR